MQGVPDDANVHPSWNDYPKLLAELDLSKNKNLTFRGEPIKVFELACGTSQRLDWRCTDCEHEWKATGSARRGGSGCLACKRQAVHSDGSNSLLVLYPEIAEEFHPDLNEDISPEKLLPGSSRKRWWICKRISRNPCGHIWQASPYTRTKGHGCPVCSKFGHAIHIDGRNSMRQTHPELAEEFHPTKNGNKTPENTIAGTNKRIWWRCRKCTHEWPAPGGSRVSGGNGCPACSNQAIHSDGRNSMRVMYPEIAREFHPTKNGNKSPDQLIGSGGLPSFYWICKYISDTPCGYVWKSRRIRTNEIYGCPVCTNNVLHPDGRNSIAALFPDLSKEFHPFKNGHNTPENTLPGSRIRIHWVCTKLSENPCGHEWETFVFKRTTGSETNCPACSKGGFDPSKPGHYYVLKIENVQGEVILYKGGITNQFETRLAQHQQRFGLEKRSQNWKLSLEELVEFKIGQEARELETKLLQIEEIRAPNIDNVSSELFMENPLQYARNLGLIS